MTNEVRSEITYLVWLSYVFFFCPVLGKMLAFRGECCVTISAPVLCSSALWLNAPGLWIILYLGCLIGTVVYAFYSECDPISSGLISSKDQVGQGRRVVRDRDAKLFIVKTSRTRS